MNGVAWLGGVCMAAAGCTLLHILVGNKGIGKVFRLVTAAFFVCALMMPLLQSLDDLRLPSLDTETQSAVHLQETAYAQFREVTEQVLLRQVNAVLQSHKLSARKIEVEMDTLEDGRISITDIVVYISSENALHRNWAKQIITERLGTDVRVIYAD